MGVVDFFFIVFLVSASAGLLALGYAALIEAKSEWWRR